MSTSPIRINQGFKAKTIAFGKICERYTSCYLRYLFATPTASFKHGFGPALIVREDWGRHPDYEHSGFLN